MQIILRLVQEMYKLNHMLKGKKLILSCVRFLNDSGYIGAYTSQQNKL